MRIHILSLIILALMPHCKTKNETKDKVEIEKSPIEDSLKSETFLTETELDSFFYSTIELQLIGEANKLDVLRMDRPTKLDIVGVIRETWDIKEGDSIAPFLVHKIRGLENMELSELDTIEISSNLSADDTWIIFIENQVVKSIKNWQEL